MEFIPPSYIIIANDPVFTLRDHVVGVPIHESIVM